jgi:hypothetical protein
MRPPSSRALIYGSLFLAGSLATVIVAIVLLRAHFDFGRMLGTFRDSIAARAQDHSPAARLEKAELELSQAKDDYHRWLALGDAALWNTQAGDWNLAQIYAEELLATAPRYGTDWNYGNAIHDAHSALGLVALRSHDIAAAKAALLEAGKTPGSPQLDSFGPNTTLAKELLEHGEREVVLQYFDLIAVFWEMGGEELPEWRALVKAGRMPDFGAHLVY